MNISNFKIIHAKLPKEWPIDRKKLLNDESDSLGVQNYHMDKHRINLKQIY